MANRGKKRRRKDGSVASGKTTLRASSNRVYEPEPLDPVPVNVLAEAMTIAYRYVPFNPDADPKSLDDESGDWDWESLFNETRNLADEKNVDSAALGGRAEKLLALLRELKDDGLYIVDASGSVTIEADLLAFAASTSIDDSDAPLAWHGLQK